MADKRTQLIGLVAGVLACLGVVFLVAVAGFSVENLTILLLSCVVFVVAFLKTDVALVFLIFSMLFSPELSVGGIPGRSVVLRVDDIFLLVVFLGWLAKTAVHKEIGLLKNTRLNPPIVIYIFLSLILTLLAAARGNANFGYAVFYLLKYIEYFILFFMVTNSLKGQAQARRFVYVMVLVFCLVGIYAWMQHLSGVARVAAPFDEAAGGEANTLGGYLIFMIMVSLGLALNVSDPLIKGGLAAALCIGIPALLFTLSRGSWLGFLPSFFVLTALTRRNKLVLIFVTVIVALSSSVIFPRFVKERISSTFVTGKDYTVLGKKVQLEESASARIENWGKGLEYSAREPLFGYGVGNSPALLDNQYARVLIEVGYPGFIVFIWLLFMVYRSAMRTYIELRDDRFSQGLAAGFIAGFVGLLVHAFSAETFIIIRIMEPFWFLTAVVVMLPELAAAEQGKRGLEAPG
jgi:O-antigen ligase